MFIKNNETQIWLNDNGSVTLGSETYYDKDFAYSKKITKELELFTDYDDSIELEDIPFPIRKKLNKTIGVIFDNLDTSNENSIEAINRLNKFGFLKTQKDSLAKLKKATIKNALTFGMHSLEESYIELKKSGFVFEGFEINEKIIDREKIAKFVEYFKNANKKDYLFFSETLKDFGLTNEKDILNEFNDNINENYTTREFGLASQVKRKFIDLQEEIINDAAKLGYLPPTDLPMFVSSEDFTQAEKLNPQKIKLIAGFNFEKNQERYQADLFDNNGSMKEDIKEELRTAIKNNIKVLDTDFNNNLNFINLQLFQNNGFSYDRMIEWAKYSSDNEIVSPSVAYSVALSGLRQCNKLVECGILEKSVNGKDFKFTSPRSREILFGNSNANYNELADIVIYEHNIEFNTQIKDDSYDYIRKPIVDFNSNEVKEAININWDKLQAKNRAKGRDDTKSTVNFIDISAIKFDGIDLEKLEEWKESVVSKERLTEEVAQSFIDTSIQRGNTLVKAGLMIKDGDNNFIFADDFAKEVLYKNLDSDISTLVSANLGKMVLKKDPVEEKILDDQKKDYKAFLNSNYQAYYASQGLDVFDFINDLSTNGSAEYQRYTTYSHLPKEQFSDLSTNILFNLDLNGKNSNKEVSSKDILEKLNSFNFYYGLSLDDKYVSIMKKSESELLDEVKTFYEKNVSFALEIDSAYASEDIDEAKKLFLASVINESTSVRTVDEIAGENLEENNKDYIKKIRCPKEGVQMEN